MLVCFRCGPETKSQLDSLVLAGSYRDRSEAIAAAVANLFLMEKEFASKGDVVVRAPEALVPATTPDARALDPIPQQNTASTVDGPIGNVGHVGSLEPGSATAIPTVPDIFRITSLPSSQPRGLSDLPPDMWRHGDDVPLDRWILGQFNRLLPAKANSRALINLFAKERGAIRIGSAARKVAGEAVALGRYLASIDQRYKIPRDDALSTAFPQPQKNPAKGRLRYANQFVVYQNGRGELSGLMIDLKLINVEVKKNERRILPTHAAWEFAKIESPILDGSLNGTPEKFSEEERSFLIEHILRGVPVESFAYRMILNAVLTGHDTPEKIDDTLRALVAEDRAEKLSQSFLTSQRSGAISRMSDLGLIERRRDGVRVSYSVTDDGRRFLVRCENFVEL